MVTIRFSSPMLWELLGRVVRLRLHCKVIYDPQQARNRTIEKHRRWKSIYRELQYSGLEFRGRKASWILSSYQVGWDISFHFRVARPRRDEKYASAIRSSILINAYNFLELEPNCIHFTDFQYREVVSPYEVLPERWFWPISFRLAKRRYYYNMFYGTLGSLNFIVYFLH